MKETCKMLLANRGVTVFHIAQLVMYLQKPFVSDLKLGTCERLVEEALEKREIQNAILVGINLDILAEDNKLMPSLNEMMMNDFGGFGCDESLALAIAGLGGAIGISNFGFLDRNKVMILKQLDGCHDENICMTFTDDLVAGIASYVAGEVAQKYFSDVMLNVESK